MAWSAVCLSLVTAATAAQGPLDRANQLVRDAQQLAIQGDTSAALDRLQQAIRAFPNLAEAHFRRGQLLARLAGTGPEGMFRRHQADNALEQALKIDRQNPLYMLELGQLWLKEGFRRLEAERIFSQALDAARARGDAKVIGQTEAELGDVYLRRYQSVADRRMIFGGVEQFDAGEALSDPHYTADFLAQHTSRVPEIGELDLRQAEQHFRGGVSAAPMSDEAEAGLLGILLDGARYEEYLDIAKGFVRAAPQDSRAQLYYGAGLWRANRVSEAGRAFSRALGLMTPAERGQVGDLSLILRKVEAERYNAMSPPERAEFERIYWSQSDPLRLTPENEHWLEHIARVAYADLRYSAPDLRLRGWQTDRGTIYIRYGPPPVTATFPPNTDQVGEDPGMIGKVVTLWYYPERNLSFVFYGPPGYNYARFAGEFQAYADDARTMAPTRYDNVPVDAGMDSVSVQAAAFKALVDSTNPVSTATDLVLYAGVPVKRMSQGVDLAAGPLETGFFLTDWREREIVTRRQTETVQFRDAHQFESRFFSTTVTPGEYRYRVEALQTATRKAARGMAAITLTPFSTVSVSLSDVVMAHRVVPKMDHPANRLDFFVDPSPDLKFDLGSPVSLYWETYGLTPDSGGVARYQVDVFVRVDSLERHGFGARVIGGVLDAIGASARGDDQVAIRYTGTEVLNGRDRIPAWLTLELGNAPAGSFGLDLVITDLVTGHSATRHRSFTIAAPTTRDR